jgi:hypothetical protein
LVTGVMALLLPETLNRHLAETIEEIETWTRSAPKLEDRKTLVETRNGKSETSL